MKTSYRFVLDHKVLLNRSPCTHIWNRNDIRQHVSRDRLFYATAVSHRSFLQVLAMFRLVDVVEKNAIDFVHPLQQIACIGLTFFPKRQKQRRWTDAHFSGSFLQTHRFSTQVTSMTSFSWDSWSFFSRSYSCLSLFLNSTLILVLFACISLNLPKCSLCLFSSSLFCINEGKQANSKFASLLE